MTVGWLLLIPVIVFVTVVGPIWITLHYVTEWKRIKSGAGAGEGKAGEEQVVVSRQELAHLRDTALRLGKRLDALERIVDVECDGRRGQ